MKRLFAFMALAALAVPSRAIAGPASGDGIVGIWHTAEDKSRVQIFKKDDRYFGKIISLKDPNWPANDEEGMGGKPKNDRRNPDTKQRSRPIVGLVLMTDFKFEGDSLWDGGKVYDPESGKTYKGKMTLTDPKRLEMRGFVGISLFGRTEVWTRE